MQLEMAAAAAMSGGASLIPLPIPSPPNSSSSTAHIDLPSQMPPAFKMAGLTWSDQETYELIKIWAADRDMLDGTSRNNKVYESMAAQMRTLGYMRTALQVKEKMKRLRKEYKYGKRSKKIATYHEALSSVLSGGPFKPCEIPLSNHPNPPMRIDNDRESLPGSEDYPNSDHDDGEPAGNGAQSGTTADIKLLELNNNSGSEADRNCTTLSSEIYRTAAALSLLSSQAEFQKQQLQQTQAQAVAQLPPIISADDTMTNLTRNVGIGAATLPLTAPLATLQPQGLKRKFTSSLNNNIISNNNTCVNNNNNTSTVGESRAASDTVVTALAQNIMDSINRGVSKFMELEERRMTMELEMIERMRKEDLERQERLRREEMHHEVRLMTLIAGLFQQTAKTGETPANLGSLLKELQASVDHRSGGGPMAPLHSESYSDEDSDDDDDSVLGKKMRIDESVKTE
ncbi:uncharacterized protein LOC111269935 isoform X3 [Varroa jacobsoni]|nr:uncharacterized protein LOC111243337 isoform X3 [Varroa destructor]XP_022644458.1 uncharacterized protein LOC111243337 isoform X3 [Varroa destructor]XP_022644459.1 uncharacterized protein LOC111243337 isoform X3 [Varroa destructor]XP_022644460.1 uncharacterized protein LOC111243337 isoform X3 [Varroa destructor]XP_022705611.1 uncharacterized protein LOC111269935 isoform X3 [Varroa jacobsoni]XP_022705621.1 uncharacterized protein LOC111269935 isoform X3 [Varroa jacobsoni]XP_022705628.1 unch